jgi:hypothetical protein
MVLQKVKKSQQKISAHFMLTWMLPSSSLLRRWYIYAHMDMDA